MKSRTFALVGVTIVYAFLLSAAWASVPRTMAFQGVLTSSAGAPLPDGSYPNVTFRLYDHLTGPAQVWSETKPVVIAGGHGAFATALGSAVAIPTSVAFDKPYWLSVQVGTDAEMSPRLALGAAPYALSLALPFAGSAGTPEHTSALSATNTDYGTGVGGYSVNGYGVEAISTFGNGLHAFGSFSGVEAYSTNGVGVYADGNTYGISASASAPLGIGVSATGNYWGVGGTSSGGDGVFGNSSTGFGVYGQAGSASGFGVYGINQASGPSVGSYYKPGANGVGLFAGDWGWFGSAAIETDLTGPGTHIFCAENGIGVFYVAAGGAVHALSYGNLSDARYKQDIRTVGNPLATVEKLRGVSFEWKQGVGRSFPKGRQIGFVAQEVRKALPKLVSEDDKGYLSVEYANVVPVLVEAVKEQQKEIAAADLANARLRARLSRLERQVSTIAAATPHRTLR